MKQKVNGLNEHMYFRILAINIYLNVRKNLAIEKILPEIPYLEISYINLYFTACEKPLF